MKKDGRLYFPLFLYGTTMSHGTRIWIFNTWCGQGNELMHEVNLFSVSKLCLLQKLSDKTKHHPSKHASDAEEPVNCQALFSY
jgi:hypothetical protein